MIPTRAALGIALLLAFLPWTRVSCDIPEEARAKFEGRDKLVMVQQRGFQAALGMVEAGEALENEEGEAEKAKDGGPIAIFALLAILGTVAALVVSIVVSGSDGTKLTTILSGVSAALLVLQFLIGFPIFNEMDVKMKGEDIGDNPFAQQILANLDKEHTVFFWLTIIALIAAAVTAGLEMQKGGGSGKRRKSRGSRTENDDAEETPDFSGI